MTRRDLYKQNNNLRWWVVIMGVVLAIMTGMWLDVKHKNNSLMSAAVELQTCERHGGVGCHIELDGNNYNVYSW